jgi:lipopolysaccharide exporter
MSALKKITSGVSWGSLSVVVVTFFQLFFMGVMARLLDPADFGLIAIANVSLRFYIYFSQAGIAPALIQKKSLEDGHVNAALALSLGISIFFFLLAYVASPFTEAYFEMANLSVVMQVLAINFVVLGFSSISQALLRRKSQFKEISMIEMFSYVLGYGVTGIIAAYMGLGVWSLVVAFMTQSILSSFLLYSVIRYPIRFNHSKGQRKSLFGYGVKYSFIGFVEFITANIMTLIIGKLLGAVPAGIYDRALLLGHLPVQKPANILTQTLFPVISKMNDEHDKQLISFQLSTLVVGCYACAVGIGLHNAAYDIVSVLLGSKWLEVAPILKIIALSVAPFYIAHSAGIALDAMAKLNLKLRIQLIVLLLMIMQLVWIMPNISIENIVYVVLSMSFIRLLLMYGSVAKLLHMSKKELIMIVLTFISVTTITGAFTYAIPTLLIPTDILVVRLIIDVLAGVIGLMVSLMFSRYFLNRLHSVAYLKSQLPVFKKIMEI